MSADVTSRTYLHCFVRFAEIRSKFIEELSGNVCYLVEKRRLVATCGRGAGEVRNVPRDGVHLSVLATVDFDYG